MAQVIRNVFISHIHEDDEGLADLKALASRHGMDCRDASITKGKFNEAHNEDYIKYQILAPRINWCSVLVAYISPETKNSDFVAWEIEYAHKRGKRIVGVWERGAKDCELPEALDRYAHAVVGWNGKSIIDAIQGNFNKTGNNRSVPRTTESNSDLTGLLILGGIFLGAVALSRLPKPKRVETERQGYALRQPRIGMRYPYNQIQFGGR